jgi:hypothetical protein
MTERAGTNRLSSRPGWRLSRLSPLCLAVAAALAVPRAGESQSIVGRVREDPGGAPLRGAEIRLLARDGTVLRRVLADSAGQFRLVAPSAGTFGLEAELLGYAVVRSSPLDVPLRRELDVELMMSRTAIPLEPIRVLAVRADNRLSDYYRRADWAERSGFGTVYTRADIERIRAPFARLYVDGTFKRDGAEWVAEPRIGCRAETYLNGMPASLNEIDMINPDELEGVETYVRMEVPPQYQRASGPCAVALFWTRMDGGSPLTWPRLLGGLAIVTGIVLFAR